MWQQLVRKALQTSEVQDLQKNFSYTKIYRTITKEQQAERKRTYLEKQYLKRKEVIVESQETRYNCII